MSITETAMHKAVVLLRAAGVKYAILLADGTKLGELEVVVPKPPKAKSARAPRVNFIQYGYKDELQKMQPGDVHVFDAPKGVDVQHYSHAVSAMASSMWGNGAHMYETNGESIELLRLK